MTKAPLPATPASFENAMTGTFDARAIGATARTSSASKGPRINLFPSASARCAAAAAPVAVSYIVTRMRAPPVSSTAILAALAMDVPTPAFGPVSGTSSATRFLSVSVGSEGVTGSGTVTGGGAVVTGGPFGTTLHAERTASSDSATTRPARDACRLMTASAMTLIL
jgi:hypothetical protein